MKKLWFCLIVLNISSLMAQKTDSLPSHVYNWIGQKTVIEHGEARRNIMQGSTTSLADFEVHAVTLQPGKTPQSDIHSGQDQLIIVKDGQLKITLNGVSKILGSGCVVFTLPPDNIGIENAGNTPATYYVFNYKSRLTMNLDRAKQNGGSFIINWNDVPVEKTDKGHRRAFFNKPTSQLEKLEMHTTALNPGLDSHAPHTHKEEEIILMIKGNVQMHIGKDFLKVGSGDVVFLSSGVSHNLVNTGNEQCEYFAFQWRN